MQTPDRAGRTLRLYGPADLDDTDPACAHGPRAAQLLRLCTRQLFSYRPIGDPRDWRAHAPVPDLALDVPSTYNAGVGASHRSYVVHLRPDVRWDTGRPLSAHDVVRGIKRLADPVRPAPALAWFTSTIRGLRAYHDEAVRAFADDPTGVAEFQRTHDIAGVFALDELTVMFELERPAIDFINILALPCATPAPQEHEGGGDLPQSLGPYRLVAHERGRRIRLEANPAWRADTDPLRRQHFDAVDVTIASADPAQVTERLLAGEADLPWGPAAPTPGDPRLAGAAAALDPVLILHPRGVFEDPAARRAVAASVDRTRIAALLAGLDPGTLTVPATSIVPPGHSGSRQADPPVHTRAELPHRPLTIRHCADPTGRRAAEAVAADLRAAGLEVRLTTDAAADATMTALSAPWQHHNSRVFLQAVPGGHEVDKLVERALDEPVPEHAEAVWAELEDLALREALVVPLTFRTPTTEGPRSARIRDLAVMPSLGYLADLATVTVAEEPS
jgi:peptide/nickel transport system substrate-binding protein